MIATMTRRDESMYVEMLPMDCFRTEKATGAPVVGSQMASNTLKRTFRVSRVARPLKGDSEEVSAGGPFEGTEPFGEGRSDLLAVNSAHLARQGWGARCVRRLARSPGGAIPSPEGYRA